MEITIKEILIKDSSIEVIGENEYGNILLKWTGLAPLISQNYQVELEVSNDLIWNQDIIIDISREAMVISENSNYITGKLESIDEDGYAVLRIGKSIIPFSTTGIPLKVGQYIKIKSKDILAYPIEY